MILAESAIERVPSRLTKHPSVVVHSQKRAKDPGSLILDRSYHHSAMKMSETQVRGQNFAKRGRPDIAFHTLLQVLGSPLNREGLLRTYVHTLEDKVIEIDQSLRLPRNYDRFIGLLEQLYDFGSVPPGERPLMNLRDSPLSGLLEELKPSMTVAFSTIGSSTTTREACSAIVKADTPVVLIGGFARSHFEESTIQLADQVFSIDRESLDAWVVAARIVYEYECGIHLPEKRLQLTRPRT